MNIALFQHADNLQAFKAGETIFKEGEPGHLMYVVVEGEAEISVHGHPVEVVSKEGIIGEMALIDPGQPRSAQVTAKTDCRLAPIDEKRFQFLVQQTPYFSIQVMRIMADRLRRIHDLIP
jgi:CRP-like cAMP-binding protein